MSEKTRHDLERAYYDRATDASREAPAVQGPTRSAAGEQSFSPAAGSSSDVQPSANGVAGDSCDIFLRNTGIEILWITTDETTDSGLELKPDEDTGELFYGHTSTDGDLAVRTDSGASGAGAAEALYRE
jgi:hypothetical protein